MPKELKPGIHPDLSMDAYIADPCPEPSVSKGVIDTLVNRSPLHAHMEHPRLGGGDDDDSNRADLGSAAHAMLSGDANKVGFIDADSYRTDAAKTARAECYKRGQIPMLAKFAPQLDTMQGIAHQAMEQFGPGDYEQTLIWQEGDTWLKSRPDFLTRDRRTYVDYKTAANADPATWIKTVLTNSAYDIQAALGLRGLTEILGPAEREFVFLVQEITPPYACSAIGAGPLTLELANKKVEAGLRIWKRCISEDRWPGYDERIHWAEPPSWAQFDWENRDAAYHSDRSA